MLIKHYLLSSIESKLHYFDLLLNISAYCVNLVCTKVTLHFAVVVDVVFIRQC